MNIQKKPGFAVVLLAAALFLLQSCATIIKTTTQKIPVTSAPIGAKVLVDGKDMGTTPLTLKLKKKKPAVIRIEQEGYNPREIRIVREKPDQGAAIMGNLLLVGIIGAPLLIVALSSDGDIGNFNKTAQVMFPTLLVLGTTALITVDFASGAPYSLYPEALDVVLTRADGEPRPDVTEIDEARLRDVKWLRIRALDKTAHRTD